MSLDIVSLTPNISLTSFKCPDAPRRPFRKDRKTSSDGSLCSILRLCSLDEDTRPRTPPRAILNIFLYQTPENRVDKVFSENNTIPNKRPQRRPSSLRLP